ncbi:MAG: SIMPL domain-containing protein, partial [Dehalococcoidia bacterium]
MTSVNTLHIHQDLRRILLLAGAAALVALAIGCTPTTQVTVAGDAQTSHGIAVTGRGAASVSPDVAMVNLGVEVNAPTVAEARSQAAMAMEAIEDAITGHGVEERDIQTQHFNIYPQYSYPQDGTPQITGFVVSNLVAVKVR